MSQSEVNKITRLLSEKPLKFTVLITMKDGQQFEFQANREPKLKFCDEAREVVLSVGGDYGDAPACRWADITIIHTEANPV